MLKRDAKSEQDGNYIALVLTECLWVPVLVLRSPFILVLIHKKRRVGAFPALYRWEHLSLQWLSFLLKVTQHTTNPRESQVLPTLWPYLFLTKLVEWVLQWELSYVSFLAITCHKETDDNSGPQYLPK